MTNRTNWPEPSCAAQRPADLDAFWHSCRAGLAPDELSESEEFSTPQASFRRLMLKGYEANGYENNGLCYPLADYTQKEVLAYMRQHNLPQPIRYSLKASNGVGFSLDCFLWLRKNYPQDLERIYQVFPMSRRILFEYDNKQNNNG